MQKILKKLHSIQGEVERMEKDGFNNFNKYKYLSETQITFKMKTLLDKHGVVFHYSAEIMSCNNYEKEKGGNNFLTHVRVKYSFIDIESAEKVEGTVDGQGMDSGDKGVYKAITGAIKYIYMKTFNIPTGDDPENDRKGRKKEMAQPGILDRDDDPLKDNEDED